MPEHATAASAKTYLVKHSAALVGGPELEGMERHCGADNAIVSTDTLLNIVNLLTFHISDMFLEFLAACLSLQPQLFVPTAQDFSCLSEVREKLRDGIA